MKPNFVRSTYRWFVLAALVGAALLAACSTPTVAPAPSPVATAGPAASSAGLTPVTVVMGYIPDIQFAPFYVAQSKGFFAAQGLNVKFQWGFEVDGMKLLGVGQADFAMLGGDQVIQARAQNIPLVYVANYYNAYPISVFSLKEKNITTPKDLIGKKVGLPAFWGASYTGWRALLYAAGIKESDIKTQDIGFTQAAAVTQGVVDAAVGYSNNDPVKVQIVGKEINVIPVSDYSRLVGMGLVTNEKTIAERRPIVQKMVTALLQAVKYTIENPDDALAISLQQLPEAGGTNLPTTRAVLAATIKLWTNPHLGYVDPADWTASAKFMQDAGFIQTSIDVTKAYTNAFIQ